MKIITSFDISIATGLALESIFEPTSIRYDKERKIPNIVDMKRYKGLIINGYTLIRNIIEAYDDGFKPELIIKNKKLIELIAKDVEEEIEIIKSLFLSNLKQDNLYIFLPNYTKVITYMNNGKDANIGYINYNINLIKLSNFIFQLVFSRIKCNIISNSDHKLPISFHKGYIIMTHFTIDLCNSDELFLLESHTGIIKSNINFYTKFAQAGQCDLSRIPVNLLTLFFLGDKSLVRGLSFKNKKMLSDLSLENKWTYRTSETSILYQIKRTDLAEELKHYKSL